MMYNISTEEIVIDIEFMKKVIERLDKYDDEWLNLALYSFLDQLYSECNNRGCD